MLTPAQRDEIRIASGKVAEQAVADAVKRYGGDPLVIATAVEGLFVGGAMGAWQRRAASTSARRFKRLLRAILDRAHALVTAIP